MSDVASTKGYEGAWNILTKIGAFARYVVHAHEGEDHKVRTLEDYIREITSKKEKIKLSREHFERFCVAVKETNPLHFNAEFARQKGFEDVFAPGMQLAALGEQYINELVAGINEVVGVPYVTSEISLGLGKMNMVYPGKNLLWVCYDFDISPEDGLKLSIIGGERKNLRTIDLTKPEMDISDKKKIRKLGTTMDILLREGLPQEDKYLYGADYRKDYQLDRESVDNFLQSIEEKPENHQGIPLMYSSSFFTATILDYFKAKLGEVSGIHVGSEFSFYGNPSFEKDLVVELFLRKSRRIIDCVASQDHKSLVYGKTSFVPLSKSSATD